MSNLKRKAFLEMAKQNQLDIKAKLKEILTRKLESSKEYSNIEHQLWIPYKDILKEKEEALCEENIKSFFLNHIEDLNDPLDPELTDDFITSEKFTWSDDL